jgi:hypothetical protein
MFLEQCRGLLSVHPLPDAILLRRMVGVPEVLGRLSAVLDVIDEAG